MYLGDDPNAVANAVQANSAIYRGRQERDNTTYSLPDGLGWGQTYYWRVDEVEDAGVILRGEIWSFTTADFILVDGFETYNNDLPTTMVINQNWEGMSGAIVGYSAAPYAERRFVHVGKQSMPLFYTIGSKAERTFALLDDWTVGGVNILSVWFRGAADNYPGQLYVAVADSAGSTAMSVNPDPNAVLATEWTKWQIPLSDFSANGVNLSAVAKMSIGVADSPKRTHRTLATPFAVEVSADEQKGGKIEVDTIKLVRGPGWLRGTVRDVLTGKPITDANIVFTLTWDDGATSSPPSSESFYEFCLGSATYDISVKADGYSVGHLACDTMGYVTIRDVLLAPKSAGQLGHPVYRFLSPTGSWYFSADESEKGDLLYDEEDVPGSASWTYDGIAFSNAVENVPPAGGPVYRLWCKQGDYTPYPSYPLYTTSADERNDLLTGERSYLYEDEGIAFNAYCTDPQLPKCKAVYRFASERRHFYTVSKKEMNTWDASAEWTKEDIIWYAFDYVDVDALNDPGSP